MAGIATIASKLARAQHHAIPVDRRMSAIGPKQTLVQRTCPLSGAKQADIGCPKDYPFRSVCLPRYDAHLLTSGRR
jgi:hypothetical protein